MASKYQSRSAQPISNKTSEMWNYYIYYNKEVLELIPTNWNKQLHSIGFQDFFLMAIIWTVLFLGCVIGMLILKSQLVRTEEEELDDMDLSKEQKEELPVKENKQQQKETEPNQTNQKSEQEKTSKKKQKKQSKKPDKDQTEQKQQQQQESKLTQEEIEEGREPVVAKRMPKKDI